MGTAGARPCAAGSGELHSQTLACGAVEHRHATACKVQMWQELVCLKRKAEPSANSPRSDGPSRLSPFHLHPSAIQNLCSKKQGYAVWRAPVHGKDCFFFLCTHRVPLNLRCSSPFSASCSSYSFIPGLPILPRHSQPERRSFLSPPESETSKLGSL